MEAPRPSSTNAQGRHIHSEEESNDKARGLNRQGRITDEDCDDDEGTAIQTTTNWKDDDQGQENEDGGDDDGELTEQEPANDPPSPEEGLPQSYLAVTTNHNQKPITDAYSSKLSEAEVKNLQNEIRAYVKETMFRTVKFLPNQVNQEWDFPHFAGTIMKQFRIPQDRVNERRLWWSEHGKLARKSLDEKRSSVTQEMKRIINGRH
jgi:hypothetical protein